MKSPIILGPKRTGVLDFKEIVFSLAGLIKVGSRVTPKRPAPFNGRCVLARGNVDRAGSGETIFDVLVQPADQSAARRSIFPAGSSNKLVVPTGSTAGVSVDDTKMAATVGFGEDEFFTLDVLQAGVGAKHGEIVIKVVSAR